MLVNKVLALNDRDRGERIATQPAFEIPAGFAGGVCGHQSLVQVYQAGVLAQK